MRLRVLALVLLWGCGDEAETRPDAGSRRAEAPAVGEPEVVVPSARMPAEVVSQDAHNNLDIVRHDGRLYFAFRTAPSHFASSLTTLYVVSTEDEVEWRFEGEWSLGTDLREPRFLSLNGRLWLYFAVLGDDPLAFEPGGSRVVEYHGPGAWTEPVDAFTDDFIPWRMRVRDGVAYVTGYTGGGEVYTPGADPIRVHWLQSVDGETWEPVVPGRPVVLEGGGSETDLAFLPDGAVVAVTRNEGGSEDGSLGSRICRAEASSLGDWRCEDDPRKYDSPLVFYDDGVWLVGRRNVTDDGHFDVAPDDLSPEQAWAYNQAAYWMTPKRCSLWKVDPHALTVELVLDLPSAGDTCFASEIDLGGGRHLLYNYSSPFEPGDISWLQGQNGETFIYRATLSLP